MNQVQRYEAMKRGLRARGSAKTPVVTTLTLGEIGIGINAVELAIAHIEGSAHLDATDRRQLRQLRSLESKLAAVQGAALVKLGGGA